MCHPQKKNNEITHTVDDNRRLSARTGTHRIVLVVGITLSQAVSYFYEFVRSALPTGDCVLVAAEHH